MKESQSYLWAIGIIYWYKRKSKHYLRDEIPGLPFEAWGAFYVFDYRFDQIQLRRKKPRKGQTSYQWVTKEQIIRELNKS